MHNEKKLRTSTLQHIHYSNDREAFPLLYRHVLEYSINPVDSATLKAVSYEILGIGPICPKFTLTPFRLTIDQSIISATRLLIKMQDKIL